MRRFIETKKVWVGFFSVVVGMLVWNAPAVWAAVIKGSVSFEGQAPDRKPLSFGAEKQCAQLHGDKMPLSEDLIVNANHTVKDVLVYVKEGVSGECKAPEQPVLINQVGCVFVPHVAVAMVGQPVIFQNDDPVLHNVRAQSKMQQSFNVAQPTKGMRTTKTLKKQEIGMLLRCDVHFWMASTLHVLAHPYFSVTGDAGTFEVKGLPAGAYTVEAWHGTLGAVQQTVTVTADETREINFVMKKS